MLIKISLAWILNWNWFANRFLTSGSSTFCPLLMYNRIVLPIEINNRVYGNFFPHWKFNNTLRCCGCCCLAWPSGHNNTDQKFRSLKPEWEKFASAVIHKLTFTPPQTASIKQDPLFWMAIVVIDGILTLNYNKRILCISPPVLWK